MKYFTIAFFLFFIIISTANATECEAFQRTVYKSIQDRIEHSATPCADLLKLHECSSLGKMQKMNSCSLWLQKARLSQHMLYQLKKECPVNVLKLTLDLIIWSNDHEMAVTNDKFIMDFVNQN